MKGKQLSSMVDSLFNTEDVADKYDTEAQKIEKPTKSLLETAVTATDQVIKGAAELKSLFNKDKADDIIVDRKETLDNRLAGLVNMTPSEQIKELAKIEQKSDISPDLGFLPDIDKGRVSKAFKAYFDSKVSSYQRNAASGLIKKQGQKRRDALDYLQNDIRNNPDGDHKATIKKNYCWTFYIFK